MRSLIAICVVQQSIFQWSQVLLFVIDITAILCIPLKCFEWHESYLVKVLLVSISKMKRICGVKLEASQLLKCDTSLNDLLKLNEGDIFLSRDHTHLRCKRMRKVSEKNADFLILILKKRKNGSPLETQDMAKIRILESRECSLLATPEQKVSDAEHC
jgi:hypothetical protein